MPGWMNHKLGSRLQGEISRTSDITLIAGKGRGTEEPLEKLKEESEKTGLKLSSGHKTGKDQFSFQSQRNILSKMLKLQYNCTHLTS